MRLRFLWVGKTKDPLFLDLEERYLSRVDRFFPAEKSLVLEERKIDPRQQVARSKQEAAQIRRKLPAGTHLVVLDAGGREFTSRRLAGYLEELSRQAVSQVTFVVGGYLGIPQEIKETADFKFSLSQLTLPHELARVLLLEQVYRAITILKRLPYHR